MEKLTKEQKREAWKNTPAALIVRPLRYIAARTNTKDEKGNTVVSPGFLKAFRAAYYGDGKTVQQIARGV